jgi:phosphate transport system permease protein
VLLSVGAFWLGKSRSLALVGGSRGIRNLHSLPSHYGLMTALWCALPALLVIVLWLSFQDAILLRLVTDQLAQHEAAATGNLSLILNDVRNVAAGNVAAGAVSEPVRIAAAEYVRLRGTSRMALTVHWCW